MDTLHFAIFLKRKLTSSKASRNFAVMLSVTRMFTKFNFKILWQNEYLNTKNIKSYRYTDSDPISINNFQHPTERSIPSQSTSSAIFIPQRSHQRHSHFRLIFGENSSQRSETWPSREFGSSDPLWGSRISHRNNRFEVASCGQWWTISVLLMFWNVHEIKISNHLN